MKIKIYTQLIMFFLLVISSQSHANSDFTFQDHDIYSETISSCKKSNNYLNTVLNSTTGESLLLSIGQSLSVTLGTQDSTHAMNNYVNQNYLGDYVYDRLQSPGFISAMKHCFPNRPDLERLFVISMMSADTIGKVPSIFSLMYISKAMGGVFTKISAKFPKTMKALYYTVTAATILYVIIEARKAIKNRQVSEEEKKRTDEMIAGVKKMSDGTGNLVKTLAENEIVELEKLLATSSGEDNIKIQNHINRIKEKLSKLESLN